MPASRRADHVRPPTTPIVDDGVLTQAELDFLVDAAIARWADAGLSAEQVAVLENLTFSVGDMSGLYLGSFAPGHITLDCDAAGHGWFLDATPLDDAEFGQRSARRGCGPRPSERAGRALRRAHHRHARDGPRARPGGLATRRATATT